MKNIISICILLFSIPMLAQKVTITGVVTDENQQPLPGATVVVEPAHTGTATDLDGRFSLNVLSTELYRVSAKNHSRRQNAYLQSNSLS